MDKNINFSAKITRPKNILINYSNDFKISYNPLSKIDYNYFSNIKNSEFTVYRDHNLYNWRINTYPNAKPIYFFNNNKKENLVFISAQYKGDTIFFLDILYNDIKCLVVNRNIFLWMIKKELII